ncbi:hypothetical protein ACFWM0_12860 [Streptomyces sp. NPDC058405]|uniref:hypothetical protein n=1 Tax=Streptomyces sp. NPDC058405 TaxID=3346482 RepID=UPI003658A69E
MQRHDGTSLCPHQGDAAAGKGTLDAVLRPDPRFLGPVETGVTEALAARGTG